MTIRVPLLNHQQSFGFSAKMIFLLWCVCGTFLLHMLESNYLTMLVKQNYEKPVDSAQDVLDRGFTIIWFPYYDYFLEEMIKQNISKVSRDLALMTYSSKVSSIHFLIIFKIC